MTKTVLITDAGSASGMALAKAYSENGARLVLNNAAGSPYGGIVYNRSLSRKGEAEGLVADIVNALGGLDVVVHNDNRVARFSIEESTDGQILESMDINAKSAFFITQAAGAYMKEHGGGSIIYISSIHAEKPTGSAFAYSMAKAAVKMLAKEAALDLGPYGVRVNAIEMGPVKGDEELFKSGISRLYDHMEYKLRGSGYGTWDEAAGLAVFLTDKTAFINGESVTVDGGFLLNYGYKYNYEELEKDVPRAVDTLIAKSMRGAGDQ